MQIGHSANFLYPGEKLVTVNKQDILINFVKGDPHKPLIIFIPGDSHLARIAYGYPQGRQQDFLSYWLQQQGYSFLGISYPLANKVYKQVHPQLSIRQWGEQITSIAKKIIQDNQLSTQIVILGWSMGGSVEQTVAIAAKKQGLDLQVFIGLAAVPPLPYIMQSGPFDTNIMRADHLADRQALYPWFQQQLAAQNHYNNHEIIPDAIYLNEFIGHIPTAIAAQGYHYYQGNFIKDINKTLDDGGVFDFAETPWIALIVDDSPADAKIALINPASWNFLRTEMIYKKYLAHYDLQKLPTGVWQQIRLFMQNLDQALTLTIQGNHFFFVGEKGAKETAQAIAELVNRSNTLRQDLLKLLQSN